MGKVVRFARGHAISGRVVGRQKFVGGHMATADGLEFCRKFPGRLRNAPAEAADRSSVSSDLGGDGLIVELLSGHPIAELHASESASGARACQAPCASQAVDEIEVRAQNAQMPPVPKPRPRAPTFLREWRKFRHLTQERAAERLSMDRSNLSKIERGLVPYDQALLELAADAYQCEPADLLMRNPFNPIWSLLDTVRQLPENQQKQIAGMIKGYLEGAREAA